MTKNFEITAGKQTPDFAVIMLATIVALKELGGAATNNKIAEQIIKNESISEEEQSYTTPKNKRKKLSYYLEISRTRLKVIDALENPVHGSWALTKKGIEINNIEDARQAFEHSKEELARRTRENKLNKTTT